jgi:hypothetical protein
MEERHCPALSSILPSLALTCPLFGLFQLLLWGPGLADFLHLALA